MATTIFPGTRRQVFAFETLLIGPASPIPLTAATYNPASSIPGGDTSGRMHRVSSSEDAAQEAYISFEGSGRWRVDADPASDSGHLQIAGDIVQLVGLANIKAFRVIATGASFPLSVSYLR